MNKSSVKRLCLQISDGLIRFGSLRYLWLTLLIFVTGIATAAFRTLDKNWWQGSTCSLGMKVNGTPEFYNYTFIIVGLMLIIFSIILIPQIQVLIKQKILTKLKVTLLKIFYFVEMVTLVLVGIIPYGDPGWASTIHIWLGFYAFINIGIVMLFAFWFFNKFPKKFLITNYIMLFLALAFCFLWISANILPYAIAEIIIITIVLSWIAIIFAKIERFSKS